MSSGFKTKPTVTKKKANHGQVASVEAIHQSLVENLRDIKDPRIERTKKHNLTDILVIAIMAVIAGDPPDKQAKAIATVLEQAELLYQS
ncbi:transposase family protein [Anabaenopsis tanganyikae CS-531]|uniref:Transposase family protein n=2 Tax=Anabaenopsis TaxID=110103 RepID=A0ABT5AUZ4_9CYAN|nr:MULTISPECIES: transposase family protein [Anabaenopsis]MDB9541143.1 transposase family protein [Anabaenopsis arnoldii]MDH6093582.1 transposase family protein [Anabaenopsis arnoldii]MDH6104778.1 transposase family protein [Anabaenopsis tanganyikae CS-531]